MSKKDYSPIGAKWPPRLNRDQRAKDNPEVDLDQLQSDPAGAMVTNFMESLKNKVELRKNEYIAMVLCVEADTLSQTPVGSQAMLEASVGDGAARSKVVTVRAVVPDLIDFLPMPGPRDDCNHDLMKMRPGFISTNPNIDVPSPYDVVKVTWRNQPTSNYKTWTDPVYLGPLRDNGGKPLTVPLPPNFRLSPKDSFEESDTAQGLIHGNDPTLHYDPTPFFPALLLKRNPFAIDPIFLSQVAKGNKRHEIYVDRSKDYSQIKGYKIIPYGIRTQEENTDMQYRRNKQAFWLPEDIKIVRRKETKMFIIKETADSCVKPYEDIYKNPTMHYGISMNSRIDGNWRSPDGYPDLEKKTRAHPDKRCTIRVNVPFGLVVNKDDLFSSKTVGCSVSSPLDGDIFLQHSSKWDRTSTMYKAIESDEFKSFKDQFGEWVSNKALPDNARPYILGPFGTPGLRTGANANQKSPVSQLRDESYWEGRLVWAKWGHYFLPDEQQADALFELVNSVVNKPPSSAYSWGFRRPRRYLHTLSFSFPAVGGGQHAYPTSNFLTKTRQGERVTQPGFPWGKVGKLSQKRSERPYIWWKENLASKYKRNNKTSGIVSSSRWEDGQSAFLEYYILCRALDLGHSEAWYVSIAAAARTYSKDFGGDGFGPTWVPKTNDTILNRYLAIGQKMWFDALAYNEAFDADTYVAGSKFPSNPFDPTRINLNVPQTHGAITKRKS